MKVFKREHQLKTFLDETQREIFHFFNLESKKRSLKGRHHFQIQPQKARAFAQGTQNEMEGSVHLTSSLRQLAFVKKGNLCYKYRNELIQNS